MGFLTSGTGHSGLRKFARIISWQMIGIQKKLMTKDHIQRRATGQLRFRTARK